VSRVWPQQVGGGVSCITMHKLLDSVVVVDGAREFELWLCMFVFNRDAL
jgi:hypothetical protein